MIPKFLKNNLDNIIALFMLVSGAFVFPLFFINPFTYYKTVQMFFSLPSISIICLAISLFKAKEIREWLIKNHPIASCLSFLFLAICFTQYLRYNTYTIDELAFSIFWITVPLFSLLHSGQLKKQLPLYFFIFLFFDLLVSVRQANVPILEASSFLSAIQTREIVGTAGNRNWHAVFLIILNAFSLYFAHHIYTPLSRKMGKRVAAILLFSIFGPTTLFSLYIMASCKCKAAWIALIIVSLVMASFELLKRNRKAFSLILFSAIVLIGAFYLMSKVNYKSLPAKSELLSKIESTNNTIAQKVDKTLTRDVRIPLWESCFKMILKYPYLGVSTARFESVLAEFRTIEYFTKPDNAIRSNHPHNSLLYIAACYGIFGFAIWLILWVLPIIICITKYHTLSSIGKLVLFCYTILFLHSLLDLIFFEWPTLLFSAILLGILWAEIAPKKTINTHQLRREKKILKNEKLPMSILYLGLKMAAIMLLALGIKSVFIAFASTYYFRLGELAESKNNKELALFYYDKGLKFDKTPQYIYRSGALAFQGLKNPQLALYYFSMFKEISLTNYAHVNGFMGIALISLGKQKEALPYLLKETVIYPLLVSSWYRLYYVQKCLGMKAAEKTSYGNLQELLKQKNLPLQALPLLLKNPEYDSHPDRIPPELLEK